MRAICIHAMGAQFFNPCRAPDILKSALCIEIVLCFVYPNQHFVLGHNTTAKNHM